MRSLAARAVCLACLLGFLGVSGPGRAAPGSRAQVPARPTPDPPAPAAPGPPGTPAPPRVVEEIQAALRHAVQRFEAKDADGVLAGVSNEYWTGPLTKATLRIQLLTIFQIYQQVRAQVRVEEVRLVGEHAWVYSTGEVSGQLPLLGQWIHLFTWERELEVARRENTAWRLFGYQQ